MLPMGSQIFSLIYFADDPWKEATLSATGTNFPSTRERPVVVHNGFHCSDLSAASARADESIGKSQQQAFASIKRWLGSWKPGNGTGPTVPRSPSLPYAGRKSATSSVKAKAINGWFIGGAGGEL